MPNGVAPIPALEAYKLEYARAADRYENIYKALWQIFSYLSAVTGALLTFGGDHFQQNLLWVLASLPLFFWYLSTYLPMNRYGDLCLARLVEIEDALGHASGVPIRHYTQFQQGRSQGFRVRGTVHILGFVLGLVFVANGYLCVRAWCSGIPLIREKPAETKVISLSVDDLKKLVQQSPPAGQTPAKANTDQEGTKKK